jgi:HSP20 family protein
MTELLRMGRSPLSVLDELAGMQSQFNRMFDDWGAWSVSGYPRINLSASEREAVVVAELAGMDPQKVDVSVVADALTIAGRRESEQMPDGATMYRRERPAGEFSRTVQLPFAADPQAVKASFRNGVLTVVIPRAESDKPRRIRVEAA